MSKCKMKDPIGDPIRRRRLGALVDRLLLVLYAVVAVAVIVGLILFALWGALRD